MTESTQLQTVRQMLQQGEYTEAYGACLAELKKGELPWEELEQLGVLSICSVIKIAPLEDLFKGNEYDEDLGYEIPAYKDEYDSLMDIIHEQVLYLRKLISKRDCQKLESLLEPVAECVYQSFEEALIPIAAQIRDSKTHQRYTNLYCGYVCMVCMLNIYFNQLTDKLRIDEYNFPELMARGELLVADRFIEQAYNLEQEIKGLSDDFPYFASDDALTVCTLGMVQAQLMNKAIENLEERDPDNTKRITLAKKNLIVYYSNMLKAIMVVNGRQHSALAGKEQRAECYNRILELEKDIQKVEQDYERPDATKDVYKAGCYIATAVYGSYDCPQVWVLRRYRDENLAGSVFGRMFIKAYYAISPTLVKWFGETAWFKRIWKALLDRKIRGLKEQGVQDAPYRDREW